MAAVAAVLPVRQRGVCCPPAVPVEPRRLERSVRVLKAIADPARLQILAALWAASEPVCICDFTAALGLSQPTVSHHMARLRRAGLVGFRRRGLWAHYSLRPDLDAATQGLLRSLLG